MAGDVPKAASYCFSVGVTDRHGGLSLRVIADYPRRRWMDGFNPRNPFHLRSRQALGSRTGTGACPYDSLFTFGKDSTRACPYG